jgi:trehalose 6-phosphate synthase/phosphatase
VAPELGRREAASLTRELAGVLAGSSAMILNGRRVVEAKDSRVDKGIVVDELHAAAPGARMLIVGDDVTDEDMFRAAPADAVTVHVGRGPTIARMRLLGPDQVRKLLTELVGHLGGRVHGEGEPGRLPQAAGVAAVDESATLGQGTA